MNEAVSHLQLHYGDNFESAARNVMTQPAHVLGYVYAVGQRDRWVTVRLIVDETDDGADVGLDPDVLRPVMRAVAEIDHLHLRGMSNGLLGTVTIALDAAPAS